MRSLFILLMCVVVSPSYAEVSELTDLQYDVTQNGATERPFDNEYWDNHKEGIYVDIVGGAPLFSSRDKFESKTGWPSFDRPIVSDAVIEVLDEGLFVDRIEVKSSDTGSHLGHLFNDGPPTTGMRYCINSASLRFILLGDMDRFGYGKYKGYVE